MHSSARGTVPSYTLSADAHKMHSDEGQKGVPRHQKSEFRAQGEGSGERGQTAKQLGESRASKARATAVRQQEASSRAPANDRACRASLVSSPAASREPPAASQPASPAFQHSTRLPRRRRAERQDIHERARFRRTRATSMQQEAPSGESRRASAKRGASHGQRTGKVCEPSTRRPRAELELQVHLHRVQGPVHHDRPRGRGPRARRRAGRAVPARDRRLAAPRSVSRSTSGVQVGRVGWRRNCIRATWTCSSRLDSVQTGIHRSGAPLSSRSTRIALQLCIVLSWTQHGYAVLKVG
jgi:hypothetical protein